MFDFGPSDISFAALIVSVLGFLLVRAALGTPLALIIVLIRVAIPTIYFLDFNANSWLLLDDVSYFEQGLKLYEFGWEVITLPFDAIGRENLQTVATSSHYIYQFWVAIGMLALGPFYFSPVFINVLLSFLSGRLLWNLACMGGFPRTTARAILIFSLLHWDIIAWSSFVNLKDNLILTLTTWLMVLMWRTHSERPGRGHRLWLVLQMGLCSLVFLNLRFYVPILFATAVLLWAILRSPWRGKYVLIALAVGFIYVLLDMVQPIVEITTAFGEGFLFSISRAILSPTPWNLVPEYSFLTIPALLHLVTIPLALVGGISLYRWNRMGSLLVIYFLLILLLVAFQPEYFGPRHRFQGATCLIFMQFVGFWRILRRTQPFQAN